MEKDELILEYKGLLTFSTIGRLLTMLKHTMVKYNMKLGVYKRLLSTMIEALENVYKSSDQYHDNAFIRKNYVPSFQLFRNQTSYRIRVTNPMKTQYVPVLKKKLDLINNKNPEELRLLYRKTITNGKFTEKGGAGLGLIEIAKISGKPLKYSFEPIDNNYSLYTLTIEFE